MDITVFKYTHVDEVHVAFESEGAGAGIAVLQFDLSAKDAKRLMKRLEEVLGK